jgi:hypothetical protein
MMRVPLLLVILIAALGPGVAGAFGEESFGVYFDPQAGPYSYYAFPDAFVPIDVYLVLTRPLAPFDGFECTVTRTGAYLHLLSSALTAGGVDADPSADGFAVTAPTPYPVTGDAVVLATWQFLTVSPYYVGFFLGPATDPSLPGGLPAVSLGGAPRLCPVSSCDTSLPVAWLNGGVPYDPPCGMRDPVYLGARVSAAGLPDVHIVGSNHGPTDGRDLTCDFPSIPTTGSPYLTVSFEHPDWTDGPRFRTDYRAPFPWLNECRVWPILVETDVSGVFTLHVWTNMDGWPMDPALLHDLQTGAMRYCPDGCDYPITNDGTPHSYRFELYAGATMTIADVADPATAAGVLIASPNPFNPRTTLRFDLPQAGAARLAVYDLAGRLVRTLVDGSLPQGANEIAWDGRDEAGRPVGTGAYVARLEAGGAVATTRLALLR